MTWIWISALSLALVAAVALWVWKRHDPDWRGLLPGLVGTVVGIVASVATYRWVFDASACSSRGAFTCMLNRNQGVLTFLAALLTAAGLWGAALTRAADRKQRRLAHADFTRRVLKSALEDVQHNLIHVALSFNQRRKLIMCPQLSVDEVGRICQPDFEGFVDPRIIRSARAMQRNYEQIREADDENDKRRLEAHLASLVNNSVRILCFAAQSHYDDGRSVLDAPGMQDFRALAAHESVYTCFRASEAAGEAPDLRSREVPVLCWWDDGAPEGLEVFAEGPRFRDMNHPAH